MLVCSLPFAGFSDGDEKSVVHFQGSSKMARDIRGSWDDAGTKHVVEDPVPSAKVDISNSLDEFRVVSPSARVRSRISRPMGYASSP